jgi:alginate O-acetyltransferase complex protein AlgI
MLFNSLEFFIFLPVFLVMFFATSGTGRLFVSLVASYIFYGWWDWRFTFLLAALTVGNFIAGQQVSRAPNDRAARFWMSVGVTLSLVILGFFKYFNFFSASIAEALNGIGIHESPILLKVILPVGISFYTFQTLSYVIDVYRKEVDAEPSLLRFAVFVAFFPQLVAGPILRSKDFLPQLRSDTVLTWSNVCDGVLIACWGYVMKCVIADNMAAVVDPRFDSPAAHNALSMALGVWFYAFQIYGDFAGYSLIAIGIARITGYEFPLNFDRPYFANSFSDFWQRWHISLSSWLRDYLYVPLGGNRRGTLRTYVNLMATMTLGGLWHGASWNFVLWGIAHGAFLVGQRLLASSLPDVAATRLLGTIVVFVCTLFAWVLFRAPTLDSACAVFSQILQAQDVSFSAVPQKFEVLKGLALTIGLILCEAVAFRVSPWALVNASKLWALAFVVLCLWALSLLGLFGSDAFIYFQF